MSAAEIEAGIIDQYNTMKPLYYQFENFLNYYVNQLTTKYKFKFTLMDVLIHLKEKIDLID